MTLSPPSDFMPRSWSGIRFRVQPELIAGLVNDLLRCKERMLKNGDLVEEGSGKNSLRSPALCLAELGNAILRRRPTEPLAPGEIISTGTLTGGHLTEKDDLWTTEVTGLAVSTLTLRLNWNWNRSDLLYFFCI